MRSIKKILLFLSVAQALLPVAFAQDAINIATRTRGNLPVSRITPGVAGQCLTTDVLGHTNWGACGSGGGGSGTLPQSLASASHKWFKSYDSTTGLFTQTAVLSVDLADFSATAPTTAGKIPIFDPTATNSAGGTGAYVPGDPLVQGLFADASTSIENPVAIGGYDTAGTPALHRGTWINGTPAGTEYGLIVRNIPSGTQPISGAVAVSNFPATQPVSGSVSVSNFPATQPVSLASSVTVTQATGTNLHTVVDSAPTTAITASALPLPAGASTAAKQPALGTAGTPSTDVITVQGATSGTAVKVDGSAVTQPVGGTVAATQSGTWTIQPGNTANTTAWKVDGSAVTQPVSASTLPLPTGAATSANQPALKSDNGGAPGATNEGVLPAVANAAPPSKTEGNQSSLSIDLAGNLRVNNHPPNVLGCYTVNGRTGTYTGLTSGAILVSFRWTSTTSFAVIQRVRVNVITSTAATTAGEAERELHVVRSFTVSDTGGTAVTMTGNNAKMRTSQATSAVGDFRFGQPLTAGTGTADANPVSSAVAWLPLNFTGVDIGCGGAAATSAVWSCAGGVGPVDLLNATNGQEYPLVLAQNEGWRITIGKDAMPAAAVQQTTFTAGWCEMSAY